MTLERIILKVTGLAFILGGLVGLVAAIYVGLIVGEEPGDEAGLASFFLFSIGAYAYVAIITALATGAALLGLDAIIGHLSAIENSNRELVDQAKQNRRDLTNVSSPRPTLSANK